MERKSWEEFRESGLLWAINQFLHIFGWAIVLESDKEELIVYPARVTFRGHTEEANTKNYKKLTQYMKNNIDELYNETCKEGE